MSPVHVRRGARSAFVVACAVVGGLLASIAASPSRNVTADVVMICAVVLILIGGVAVMVETMICLTNQVVVDFAERLEKNLQAMGALGGQLEATRNELVALQPKTDELAEEVAAYAAFRCLTGLDGVSLAGTGTAGLEDTGTHNVTRFRTHH